jgi:hypothetical protein
MLTAPDTAQCTMSDNIIYVLIGGAHQEASERAAPPVSVEEKEKATGDVRKMLLFLLMSIHYLN